jgi:hypothetical protein
MPQFELTRRRCLQLGPKIYSLRRRWLSSVDASRVI